MPVVPVSAALPVGGAQERPGADRCRWHTQCRHRRPEDLAYGIGRIDSSGRIADREVTAALGWRSGDRLTLTADVVTARRDQGGIVTLPARARITIPAALRRRCGNAPR